MFRTSHEGPPSVSRARDLLNGRLFSFRGRGGAHGEQAVPRTEAVIQCLGPSPHRPRADSEHPSRSVMPVEPVRVTVEPMRSASPRPSLSAEGFALLRHRSRVTDFENPEQLEHVYLPEAESLVAAETGAAFAWALPRPVLRRAAAWTGGSEGVVRDGVAPVAHVDFSRAAVGALVDAAASRRGVGVPPWRRLVVYTLWRALNPPPQDRPLAICDMRTVAAADLAAADAIANPGALAYSTEFLMLRHSARHRWCWYPDMLPDEPLLFQQLDSDAVGVSGCPHVSIHAPSPHASPRVSIETRICAFFD